MLIEIALAFAAQAERPERGPVSDQDSSQAARAAESSPKLRVTWYTDWEQARAEAKRLNRPILLQSAAPQCSGVPGMW